MNRGEGGGGVGPSTSEQGVLWYCEDRANVNRENMELLSLPLQPGFHIVVSVVSNSVLSKKLLRQIQPYETSHTTAQYDRYDRYNVLSVIEMILSPTTDTTGNGRDTTAFCKWKQPQATHTTDATKMCLRMPFVLPLLR